MPILASLAFLIQFCFVFHVFKTGRPYWWMFVIMGFPVMGCIVYYFVEIFPGSKEHRQVHKSVRKIAKALQPDADLKRRAEELEVCGSVENKTLLAEECVNHQMYEEAERLYESCLHGVFENDGAILFGLARTAVENRNWGKASNALSRLHSAAPKHRPADVQLLAARVLEGQDDNDAALRAYQELIPVYVGLEARYRYAQLLARLGQHESSMQVVNEIIKQSKRYASSLEDEQRWADAARQAVVDPNFGN